MPKNRHCVVCAKATVQRNPTRKRKLRLTQTQFDQPVEFDAQVTADHLVKHDGGEEDDGVPRDTVAVVLLDRGTGWTDVYPKGSKTTEHIV